MGNTGGKDLATKTYAGSRVWKLLGFQIGGGGVPVWKFPVPSLRAMNLAHGLLPLVKGGPVAVVQTTPSPGPPC